MNTSLRQLASKWARRVGIVVVWAIVSVLCLWSAGALYYLEYLPKPLCVLLCLVYVVGGSWMLFRSINRQRALSAMAASVVVIYLLTLWIRPSNDRQWVDNQSRLPSITVEDERVTINNFRHCTYLSETDYETTYETKRFDLQQLDRVWLIVQKFTSYEGLAHTFLSFGLNGQQGPEYFSVSVEIRRELGEEFSPLKGLYRQFELTHVVGDERDLIGMRTVHRPNDRVWMYEVNATPEQVQQLFLDYVAEMQMLQTQPKFYHTLLNNCTNAIVVHTYELTPEPINWLDPRIVLPGFAGQFAYANDLIGDRATGESFAELQARCRIDPIAREVGISESFSDDIRRRLTSK